MPSQLADKDVGCLFGVLFKGSNTLEFCKGGTLKVALYLKILSWSLTFVSPPSSVLITLLISWISSDWLRLWWSLLLSSDRSSSMNDYSESSLFRLSSCSTWMWPVKGKGDFFFMFLHAELLLEATISIGIILEGGLGLIWGPLKVVKFLFKSFIGLRWMTIGYYCCTMILMFVMTCYSDICNFEECFYLFVIIVRSCLSREERSVYLDGADSRIGESAVVVFSPVFSPKRVAVVSWLCNSILSR